MAALGDVSNNPGNNLAYGALGVSTPSWPNISQAVPPGSSSGGSSQIPSHMDFG